MSSVVKKMSTKRKHVIEPRNILAALLFKDKKIKSSRINKYKTFDLNEIDVIIIQYKLLLYMMEEVSRVLGDNHYKRMPRITEGVAR